MNTGSTNTEGMSNREEFSRELDKAESKKKEVQEAALSWWLQEAMVWAGSKPRASRRQARLS